MIEDDLKRQKQKEAEKAKEKAKERARAEKKKSPKPVRKAGVDIFLTIFFYYTKTYKS